MLVQTANGLSFDAPQKVYFSPGRVNLIGEHLDYNGGHVMPCAIDLGNTIQVSRRDDQLVRAASGNFSRHGMVEFDLASIDQAKISGWPQYLLGSIRVLLSQGVSFPSGFDLMVEGNLPNGAGLSSSASIVTGFLYALNDLFSFGLSKKQLALLAQRVEHEHIGVNCGIMDMYAILFGEEDQLVYLNTETIEHELVPLELGDYQLVISNTNKKRRLQDSQYNERRESCDYVNERANKPLAQLTLVELDNLELPELPLKRGRYVVAEEARTRQAKQVLQAGDILAFGELMNQSHYGLRDEFEVTGLELDTLSQACREEGAIGSRMTGAGFGGCVVSIFPKEQLSEALARVDDKYHQAIGYAPTHYIVSPAGGTRERASL